MLPEFRIEVKVGFSMAPDRLGWPRSPFLASNSGSKKSVENDLYLKTSSCSFSGLRGDPELKLYRNLYTCHGYQKKVPGENELLRLENGPQNIAKSNPHLVGPLIQILTYNRLTLQAEVCVPHPKQLYESRVVNGELPTKPAHARAPAQRCINACARCRSCS